MNEIKKDYSALEEAFKKLNEEVERSKKERIEKANKRFYELDEIADTRMLTWKEKEEMEDLIDEINRLEGREKEHVSAWAYDDISECGDLDAVLTAIDEL